MRPIAVFAALLLIAGCTSTPAPTHTAVAPTTPGQVSKPSPSVGTAPTSAPPSGTSPQPTAEATTAEPGIPGVSDYVFEEFEVPAGSHPHDVAPGSDGFIWYTAQASGELGRLDPRSGEVIEIPLGDGSAPHGVIVDAEGAPWVTDQGANTIVTYDGGLISHTMPNGRSAAPHTPTFTNDGILWFTGATGVIGRLDPAANQAELFDAPRGPGPYGIDVTPDNEVWFVSLEGSYMGHVDRESGEIEVFEPPTPGQGARRVWSDSLGRLWLTEWNAGQLAMYDPASDEWREWPMPGPGSQPYAIYVDELDLIWITDFGTNAIVRFDPTTEVFDTFVLPTPGAAVRQLLGRPGELWGAESATDKIVVLRWETVAAS
jgi:virginiamycin B lyase